MFARPSGGSKSNPSRSHEWRYLRQTYDNCGGKNGGKIPPFFPDGSANAKRNVFGQARVPVGLRLREGPEQVRTYAKPTPNLHQLRESIFRKVFRLGSNVRHQWETGESGQSNGGLNHGAGGLQPSGNDVPYMRTTSQPPMGI